MLPDRSPEAEDAFVAGLMDASSEDLVAAVQRAVEAGRPRLAARLFGLFDEDVEVEPGSALDRARRASAMLLVAAPSQDDFRVLVDAWAEIHRRQMLRHRRRVRGAAGGDTRRLPGDSSGRRRG